VGPVDATVAACATATVCARAGEDERTSVMAEATARLRMGLDRAPVTVEARLRIQHPKVGQMQEQRRLRRRGASHSERGT